MLDKSLAIVLIGLLVPLLAACTGNTPASDTAPAAATAPPATFAAPAESATEVPTATAESAPEAPVTSDAADSTQDVIHDIVRIPTGDERQVPEIRDIASWINSEPLTFGGQRGKVVLVDFWTYTCVNCLRTMPHLQGWYEKYSDRGLTIIGVHSPEFDFEKITENVQEAVDRIGVLWPVAQDNEQTNLDVGVLRLLSHDHTVDDLVQRLDLPVDLRGSDPNATRIERRIRSTMDNHASAIRHLDEVPVAPGVGIDVEVCLTILSTVGIVPKAYGLRWKR